MLFHELKKEVFSEGLLSNAMQKMVSLAKMVKEQFVRIFTVQFWKGFLKSDETFEVTMSISQLMNEGITTEATGMFAKGIPHITEGIAAISFAEAWEQNTGYSKFLANMLRLQEEVKMEKSKNTIEERRDIDSKNTITKKNLLKDFLLFEVGGVEIDLTKISQGKIIREVQGTPQNPLDATSLRRAMNQNHSICLENSRKIIYVLDRQWRSLTFDPEKYFPADESDEQDEKKAASVTFKTFNVNVLATQWNTFFPKLKSLFPDTKETVNTMIQLLRDQQDKDKRTLDPEEYPKNTPTGWLSINIKKVPGYQTQIQKIAEIISNTDAKVKERFIRWFLGEMFGKENAVYSSLSGRKVYSRKMIEEMMKSVEVDKMEVIFKGSQLMFSFPYKGKRQNLIKIAIDSNNTLVKVPQEVFKVAGDTHAEELTKMKDISRENKVRKKTSKKVAGRIEDNRKEAKKRLQNRKKSVKLIRVFATGVSMGTKGDFVLVFKKIN